MTVKYRQMSLSEVYTERHDFFLDNPPTFFQLLDEHIDLDEFIPSVFYRDFYQSLGRQRVYQLSGLLSALILQKILSIPTDSLLLSLLTLCKELRDFCGFVKVPDAPLITRFKQTFAPHIELMFNNMVDFTEPLCQAIDLRLANGLALDTSGVELYVAENNPKELNSLIRKLKTFYKGNPNVDPYKMAYGLMPSQAASCPEAKHQYINGHFCYADKFAILTNGLGVIRHIAFLDDAFKEKHPEMLVGKKSGSPDEDKTIGDSSALKPVLSDFFALHPDFKPDTFIGDSAFDTIDTYCSLINDFHFSKALIPYNPRNESTIPKVGYNIYGYPTCSTAKFGRTTYTHENMDFRMFPGIQRASEEWTALYKTRTVVERTINHLKINMCVAGRKTRNHLTTKADVFLAGIACQFTAIVACRMSKPEYIRSLKPLVA